MLINVNKNQKWKWNESKQKNIPKVISEASTRVCSPPQAASKIGLLVNSSNSMGVGISCGCLLPNPNCPLKYDINKQTIK